MQASIDLNFLYFMMATITCCGVAPLIAAVTWAKTTGWGACTGSPHPSSACTCTCITATGLVTVTATGMVTVTATGLVTVTATRLVTMTATGFVGQGHDHSDCISAHPQGSALLAHSCEWQMMHCQTGSNKTDCVWLLFSGNCGAAIGHCWLAGRVSDRIWEHHCGHLAGSGTSPHRSALQTGPATSQHV